jgi:lysophospholipase L1-like esterase
VALNAGIVSSQTSHWTAGTDWKWQRLAAWSDADIGSAIATPDYVSVALGSNDIDVNAGNITVPATVEGHLETIIANAKALGGGISRVILGTIIPRAETGANETARVGVNNWMRGLPLGAEACWDFDKALYVQATPATADADMIVSQPHPSFGGYQKMASIVTLPRYP